MAAWRRTPVQECPLAWCIQETHVATADEAADLSRKWKALWGLRLDETHAPLSYWSTGSASTAGVAILLTPSAAAQATHWCQDQWTIRRISIKIREMVVMNLYAPNQRGEREQFFDDIHQLELPSEQLILTGDFNSVQSPQLDRLGERAASRPESPSLQRVLVSHGLIDARQAREDADDETNDDTTDHFTYWATATASRIDRFYVPVDWIPQVVWVFVKTPPQYSDHQEVILHLRDESPGRKKINSTIISYPIQTNQPERVLEELLDDMVNMGIGRDSTNRTWDADVAECVNCIQSVKRREKQRRKRFKVSVTNRNQRLFRTRRQWIESNMEAIRESQMARVGDQLQRTTERLRWTYKRVSNWESNQTVTKVTAKHEASFDRSMTTADKFASEWAPILSQSHRTTPLEDLTSQLDEFAAIPDEQKVTDQDNCMLLQEVTEDEVLMAITRLSRHKAAGPDGLNNDFYKDTASTMVPALVRISNQILTGAAMPASFLEALIIPLRKKGDSADAMDYRPISLLQTSYKIVAKVIAQRVQTILPRVISSSQQGFVHGRQMQKTVMMMLAQLTTAAAQEDLEAALSRCILLLDFRKTYDTVDREFLYAALRKFGFSENFVSLVRNMHTGTLAYFLVNGEQSEAMPVKSGIRQGCPLAPLLFLLVVEILGLALKQDPMLNGLSIPGQDTIKHLFSAFVDDSTGVSQPRQSNPTNNGSVTHIWTTYWTPRPTNEEQDNLPEHGHNPQHVREYGSSCSG